MPLERPCLMAGLPLASVFGHREIDWLEHHLSLAMALRSQAVKWLELSLLPETEDDLQSGMPLGELLASLLAELRVQWPSVWVGLRSPNARLAQAFLQAGGEWVVAGDLHGYAELPPQPLWELVRRWKVPLLLPFPSPRAEHLAEKDVSQRSWMALMQRITRAQEEGITDPVVGIRALDYLNPRLRPFFVHVLEQGALLDLPLLVDCAPPLGVGAATAGLPAGEDLRAELGALQLLALQQGAQLLRVAHLPSAQYILNLTEDLNQSHGAV